MNNNMPNKIDIEALNIQCEKLSPQEIILLVHQKISGEKALSLSMQLEGLVLLDMLLKQKLSVFYYTIDTGRLPHETYQLMDAIRFKYGVMLHVFYPHHQLLEKLISEKGLFSFKESIENRKECCFLRKVEPNKRALKGKLIWITGLRREQSSERADTKIISYDSKLNLYKLAPLANFSKKFIESYVEKNKIPVHPLYKKGYTSIGCLPCTRPIKPGEKERSGRWWWEQGIKECGLHL